MEGPMDGRKEGRKDSQRYQNFTSTKTASGDAMDPTPEPIVGSSLIDGRVDSHLYGHLERTSGTAK